MAKSWFLYTGSHAHDGPLNPDNYCSIRVQPECICGSDLCAIYADTHVSCCKIKPFISSDLQMEIQLAMMTLKPTSNVLLKNH